MGATLVNALSYRLLLGVTVTLTLILHNSTLNPSGWYQQAYWHGRCCADTRALTSVCAFIDLFTRCTEIRCLKETSCLYPETLN